MSAAAPACPFCDSPDVELVSPWGGQLITSQFCCSACNTHFEAVRDDAGLADDWADPLPADDSASR